MHTHTFAPSARKRGQIFGGVLSPDYNTGLHLRLRAEQQSPTANCRRVTAARYRTPNAARSGGFTAFSAGRASCGIQSYGSRYAR